ncbi:MAG: hypothetical protein ACTSU3_10390 [Candidatus Thorarchaeota archaeon]
MKTMACGFQLAMDLKMDSMERDVQKIILGGGAAKALRYSHDVAPTFSFVFAFIFIACLY